MLGSGMVASMSPHLAVRAEAAPHAVLAADTSWLQTVNFYRATARLAPIRLNSELARGAVLHARYMVRAQDVRHDENLALPFATVEGQRAAKRGNVTGYPIPLTEREDIDAWMAAPFHAMALLDPDLVSGGYGRFDDPAASQIKHGATLALDSRPRVMVTTDAAGNREVSVQDDPGDLNDAAFQRLAADPKTVSSPPPPDVIWPGPGSSVPLGTYSGSEFPNPLSACAGYPELTGLPVVGKFGAATGPFKAEFAEVSKGAISSVASCVVDQSTYRNNDPTETSHVREILGPHAVIVIPRAPLVVGHQYRIKVTASNGSRLLSTFRVIAP